MNWVKFDDFTIVLTDFDGYCLGVVYLPIQENRLIYEAWINDKLVGEYLQLDAAKNAVESNQHLY